MTTSPFVRRAGTVVAALLALQALGAGAARGGDDPLARARDVAQHLSFTGRLEVDWSDTAGSHSTVVSMSSRDGVVRVDGPAGADAVFAGSQGQAVRDAGTWTEFWTSGDPLATGALPAASAKYGETTGAGPTIAGRPTTEVVLSAGGATRQRIDVDTSTGLVLARVAFNVDGSVLRAVRFVAIDFSALPPSTAAPRVVRHLETRAAARLPAPYESPASLSAGYRRVGVFRGPDGIDAVYSDGVDTLSIFESPGSLGPLRLPAGGFAAQVGNVAALAWIWPSAQAVVWQRGGVVFTAVGDGPLADLLAAAASLPRPPAPSWSQRFRHACRRFVGQVSGW